jgi:hypothetical protein
MKPLPDLLARLAKARAGVAATEMALSLPFLLGVGLWAIELSNYALTTMQVGQLSSQIADNASRVGEKSMLEEIRVYESDFNDLFEGASLQAGKKMALFDNGRVIVSGLQNNKGDHHIKWQRCVGKKAVNSSYGKEGDKLKEGMGPPGEEVYAFEGEEVIFVELVYDYDPLISSAFVGEPTIRSIASFTVRNARDISKIYQHDSKNPDPVAKCKEFSNPYSK